MVQRFRGSMVQGFRGSRGQGFKGSEVQWFKGSSVYEKNNLLRAQSFSFLFFMLWTPDREFQSSAGIGF